MGAGVKRKGGWLKGGDGQISLFLREVNKDIFVGGKRSTVHVSPCQTATMNVFQNGTGLLLALPKSQNICIINKTNTSSGEVRGVANVNKISIVKKEKNGRQRRALGNALLRRKGRRGEARKTQTC